MARVKKHFSNTTTAQDKAFFAAWQEAKGVIPKVAELLGTTRQTIYNRMDNMLPDCYYIIPVDRYFMAIAVSHTYKRLWQATGKMSRASAENFAQKKQAARTITYTTRGGEVKTMPLDAPKIVWITT